MFSLCKDRKQADDESPGIPMLALIAPGKDYKTLSEHKPRRPKWTWRGVMFMNKLHESVPGTGSICLAAASRCERLGCAEGVCALRILTIS